VSDYLFERGFRGLVRAAAEAAQMAQQSVWTLLVSAVRDRLTPRPWNPLMADAESPCTLVRRDVREAARHAEDFVHPWFSRTATRGCPPGIVWQASAIHAPPAYYPSFPHSVPEREFPLLSQPLVELCLRIPMYLLIAGGRDRALARRAFAQALPSAIVNRHSKGRIDRHVRNILDQNLDFVREILLDGFLVQQGLLDRAELERYLSRDLSPADSQYGQILQVHLCTEVWLRRWLGTVPDRNCKLAPAQIRAGA
jgi:asparagine synthase (glutamine-hydrolysing)